MTSQRLMEWLRDRAAGIRDRGNDHLLGEWMGLESQQVSGRVEQYFLGVDELRRRARELGETEFAQFVTYLVGRSQAFALDRPEASLDPLVDVMGELRRAGAPRGILGTLCELELLRAYHKIDAPGFRDSLLPGLDDLWGRLRGDVVPRLELLDVWWRTGYWCRDDQVMVEGLRRASEEPAALVGSWPYWEARRLWLAGESEEAIPMLELLLHDLRKGQRPDALWRLYVEVELGLQEATLGRNEAAGGRWTRVVGESKVHPDPMLHWNLARFGAAYHRALGDGAGELAAWRRGLEVIEQLGLNRLRCEFALSLAEAGREAGDEEAVAEGRAVLEEVLPGLRSQAELEPRRRALGDGGGAAG